MKASYNGVYGSLLNEYYVNKVRAVNRERSARIAALKTREDAEKYVCEVRAKIAAAFDLPERTSTPLSTLCGVVKQGGFSIEKLIIESRKDYPVTVNFYLPEKFSAPLPAVLLLCGHAQEGKAAGAYASAAATLAERGFAVLVVDPVSQGERYQFDGVKGSWRVAGSCVMEHNMLGKQLWLADEFFGTWRAHDALSALDYLLSRPEIDPSRVGITGNSGGGTMTTFVQALDPRFTMAAPSCYVTSWQRNIENELPADAEQMIPGILAAGCEMGDLVLAYAPRPIILLGQKNDFFDPRGLKETFDECRKVYELLGAKENLQLFIGPTNHSYSVENRCAMYDFFNTHAGLSADKAAPECEADISQLAQKDFFCTENGKVSSLAGKKLLHDLIVEKLDTLAAERRELDRNELKKLLSEKYALPAAMPEPYLRALRMAYCQEQGALSMFIYSRFGMECEPQLIVPLWVKMPDPKDYRCFFPENQEIDLYIPHLSAADELQSYSSEHVLCGVDVRGIGAARSNNCDVDLMDDFFHLYGEDYHYNSCEILFGSSTLAARVRDILSAVALAKSRNSTAIRLIGRGQGSIAALFAAVLCDDIQSVKLIDAPESFDKMARERVTYYPVAQMMRGILKYTDLPDMRKALGDRCKVVNFVNNFLTEEL